MDTGGGVQRLCLREALAAVDYLNGALWDYGSIDESCSIALERI